MKLYRLTFADLSEGVVIRYARTKRDATRIVSAGKRLHPLRELIANEAIEVPGVRSTDKSAFIDFLNQEFGRKHGYKTDE